MRRKFHIGIGFIRRRMRQGMALALLAACGASWAAEPARYKIEQPAQPLADALHAIARKTGSSVLFDPAAVQGLRAGPVSGQLSAAEAIARALQGSGLAVDVMPDGSIVVRTARPAIRSGAAGAGNEANAAVATGNSASASGAEGAPSDGGPIRLAQASVPSVSDAGSVVAEARTTSRIEITGSRLRRIDTDGAVPINTYTRDDIERSGQPSLERFLGSLNEASVSSGEGSFGSLSGQATVQLRGLPVGSTLVLINGRRLQAVGSSSGNLFNLNLIPLGAVERVEIVPVGSSAVYGGDALAGVVNIILKNRMDGQSLSVRLASGRGFGDGSFSLAGGASGERGGLMVLGTYSKATPLTASERSFFGDADYRRFGGRDARARNCTPGTVTSASGANLPGLGSSFAGIPAAAPGQALTAASFAATAGQANLCSNVANGQGLALVHGNESLGVHTSAYRLLGEASTVFTEITHVQDRLRTEEGGLLLNNVLVPASNVHNPFGVPVRVTARLGLDNGSEGFVRNTDFSRVLLGLRGDFGTRWDYEATMSTTRDQGDRQQLNGTANAAARTAALAASTVAEALNPFTGGRAASEGVLRSIWRDTPRQNNGRRDQAGAFVRGPITNLPAGAVDVIAGAEWARDRYKAVVPDTTVENSRSSEAVYGELRVPLWRGGDPGARGWSVAALTLAGRRDRYSEFGAAGTYQAGLELRPVRSLLLRASTATSFKPPTLLQTSVNDLTLPLALLGLFDPARGGQAITSGELVRSTNPGLQPEQGKAQAAGVLWEPAGMSGTRLGLTAWQVKVDGLIALLSPQQILDNEALFGSFVNRAPAAGGVPGAVTRLAWAEVNFGSVQTAGFDIEAAHGWQAAWGRWSLAASATRATKYDVALAPGVPAVQRLGKKFSEYWAPKWKGRIGVGLDEGRWSAGITSRYLGAYSDGGSSTRKLGDTWMHDLTAQLNLSRLGVNLGPAKAASLGVTLVNLSDRQPQFAEASPYFDSSQADWRGRYLSVRLSVDW